MEKAKKKMLMIVLIAVLCAAIIVCSITIPIVLTGKGVKACTHDYLPATCQSPARCVKCNTTKGGKLKHEFTVELGGKIEASCFDDGSVTYECPNCHEQRATVLPRLAHSYQVDTSASVALSCEDDEIKGYKCEHCNNSYTEIVTRHPGHVPAENAVWSDPITEEGDEPCKTVLIDTTTCANEGCDQTITRERIFDSHNDHVQTVDATCVQAGYQTTECDCGEHNDVKPIAVKPYAHVWGEPDGDNVRHCMTNGCNAEQKLVEKSAGETITAAELTGNVAIAMNDVTFAPDAALAGKMADTKLSVTTEDKTIAEIDGQVTVYDLTLKNGTGADVAFDGGKMHVSLPTSGGDYDEDCYVIRIDEQNADNKLEIMENTSVVGEQVVFETEHFSYYTVVWLSKDKLCSVIGHNFDTTVVAPTCTHDGLTVQKCRRCNYYTTSNPTKRLGHDMQQQVIAATCVEDGYTINTCSRDCGETYINNRVTTRPAHSYTATVVAPTCTKDGYTLHVCSVCKNQMRDNYVNAKGHKFSDGKCTVCNTAGGSVSVKQNFYTNLIKSLSPTNGYYVSLDGFKLMRENNAVYDISNFRYSVKVDKQGNLVGKGEGLMTTYDEYMGKGVSEQVIVMDGGNVYTYSVVNYKSSINTSRYENYSLSSQADMPAQIAAALKGEGIENVQTFIVAIFDATLKNSPTETVAKHVIETLFDKTEVSGGYVLSLNFKKVKTLFEACKTKPFSAVFDMLVGDGAYNKLADLLDGLPEKYTVDVINQAKDFVNKYGLTLTDLYSAVNDIVNLIMPEAQFDLAALLNNITGQVKDFITTLGGNGDGIAQKWDEMFDAYNDMLSGENTTAIDAISTIFRMSLSNDMLNAVDAMLDSFDNTCTVKITTDKDGKVQLVSAEANQAVFNFGRSMSVSFKAELAPTGERDIPGGKFDRTVNTVEQAKTSYVPSTQKTTIKVNGTQKVFMPIEFNGKKAMVYGTPFENMRNSVVYKSYKDQPATYNGQECTRRVAEARYNWGDNEMYVYDPSNLKYLSISSDCGGYKEIGIEPDFGSKLCYYVYVDANNRVLGWEFAPQEVEDDEDDYYYYRHMWYYYNPLTGKYTFTSPHNYKMVDSKAPESCAVDGYEKYSCANCGDTYVSTRSISHNSEIKVEYLNAGSTSCEDGVRITETCKVCGYTDTWTDYWHYEYREVAAESPCGFKMQRYTCLCGEYDRGYRIYNYGTCDFDTHTINDKNEEGGKCEHGYEYHEQIVRVCEVCKFEYIEHNTYMTDGCKTVNKRYYEVDGKQYTTEEYAYYNHKEDEPEVTEKDNIVTSKVTCSVCKELVRETRTLTITADGKTATRVLYDFTYGRGGNEYVYDDGCEAEVYRIDENGVREDEPSYRTTRHAYVTIAETQATCVRHGTETRKCLVCGDEVTQFTQNNGHELYRDYEDDTIKCYNCDQTKFDWNYYYNGYWWHYFGFDDLTEKGSFKIGYFMNNRVVAERVEFVVDYDVSGGAMLGSPVDVSFDQNSFGGGYRYDWGWDGEIELDTDELKVKLAEYPDYQTFSVVITFSWEKEAVQYALTFTRAEMDAILAE